MNSYTLRVVRKLKYKNKHMAFACDSYEEAVCKAQKFICDERNIRVVIDVHEELKNTQI